MGDFLPGYGLGRWGIHWDALPGVTRMASGVVRVEVKEQGTIPGQFHNNQSNPLLLKKFISELGLA